MTSDILIDHPSTVRREAGVSKNNSHSVPSISFVAPNAYGVLCGDSAVQCAGGAEVQQVLIARGLRDRGYKVSFITLDHGQPPQEEADGILICSAYRQEGGVAGLRFIHPRATGIWRAMMRANADVYYQRTSDSLTGIVAAFCRWHRRKFIFAAGSDCDVVPDLPHCRTLRERMLYRYGLRRADGVIAQTVTQQKNLINNFGIKSWVIRNAGEPTESMPQELCGPSKGNRPSVMWVGKFSSDKRFELLLEMARSCPGVDFNVIGDGPRTSFRDEMRRLAAEMPNIHMHGYVPHCEVLRRYESACALICTSVVEGFPNTFLEAWGRGIPVVSTYDPDGVIAERGLGVVAHDVRGLVDGLLALIESPARWHGISEAVRRYYKENHTVEVVLQEYERMLSGVMSHGDSR